MICRRDLALGKGLSKIYHGAAVLGLVGLLWGCVAGEHAALDEENTRVNTTIEVERINNPVYRSDTIRFSALSNGCTKATDFVVEQVARQGVCEVTVVRTKPDLCRKASALIDVELEWTPPSNCAGLEVVFTNPEFGELPQNLPVRTLERKIDEAAPED